MRKPMALSLDELDRLEAAHQQTGKYVYEAFMVRHHPQWNWLRRVDIGRRQLAQAQFSYPPQPDGNIRFFQYGRGLSGISGAIACSRA